MIAHTVAALALLVGPALVPSLALLGARPMTVFVTPLVGAILAAVAAELEAALGGTILTWFVILAVAANVAALASLRDRLMEIAGLRREGDRLSVQGDGHRPRAWSLPTAWSCITVVVIGLAVLWPLQALRSPILAYDGFAIWTLHSLFIYGGHGVYHSALTNPVYRFSNPNYPPLVPATGALGFVAQGGVDLRLAVIMTAVLNACALGAAGCAIVATVDAIPRALPRLSALVAGACVCLIGFGLSGVYGVGGYADLLWAASAVAAVIIGLVLPPSTRNLAAAWVCATTAGLTKPEGFITACMILLLLAARYVTRPARSPWSTLDRTPADRRDRFAWPRWAARVSLFTVVMALPGLFWVAYVKFEKIGSDFVGASGQSVSLRFRDRAGGLGQPARRAAGRRRRRGRRGGPEPPPPPPGVGQRSLAVDRRGVLACGAADHLCVRCTRDPLVAVHVGEPDHDLRGPGLLRRPRPLVDRGGLVPGR